MTIFNYYEYGWEGNVLAFRQNGTFQTFTLLSGSILGPLPFSFFPNVNVDVVVNTMGNYSKWCSFLLMSGSNKVILHRPFGTAFYANTNLGSFIPSALALSPYGAVGDS